jgi:hypothetical protein
MITFMKICLWLLKLSVLGLGMYLLFTVFTEEQVFAIFVFGGGITLLFSN